MKKPRVLIGLSEVAGHYKGLKLGFERLGIECTFLNFSEHPFGFSNDDKIWPVSIVQVIDTRRRKTRSKFAKFYFTLTQLMFQAILFFRVLPKHDIFIYCANRSFIVFIDLIILKMLGKKIIYQMHGCDSRAPYFDGAYNKADLLPDEDIYRLTRLKKYILKITEMFSDVLVNIPPQAHLCEKRYINWLYVGLCCYPLEYEIEDKSSQNKPKKLRIVHSPSRPDAKGTPLIREAIETLKSQGVEVDYIELIGVDNKIVIEEIKRADLVIDQVYADYAMPGFATEAAWQAKPVLIAGYAVDYWSKWMPKDDLPPTHFCHPNDLQRELLRIATDSELRGKIGQDMFRFVSDRWRPEQIAANYLLAVDSPPEKWWLYPHENQYFLGCCIKEEQLRYRLKNYIVKYGADGLRLNDKASVQESIVNFFTENKN